MDFRKNGRGHGKVMEFHFLAQIYLLVMAQKYAQKRLGFQHFLVMENSNWSWKSHGKVIEFYCLISV